MARWTGTKAKDVLDTLVRLGWKLKDGRGQTLIPPPGKLDGNGNPAKPYPFHYHAREVVGPPALAKLARYTGITPKDL